MNMDAYHMRQLVKVMASIARAHARVEGMKAENMQREYLGQSMAYTEDDFLKAIDDEGIGYNDVIAALDD